MSTILWWFGRGSKLGRWKSSVSGCLMNWLQIRKLSFWSIVVFYSTQWAILQSYCDVWWNQDFVWQHMRTSSWLDWEEDPKNFSKLNSHAKVMVTVWWSAVVWSTTAFWILTKLLHLRSMLSKLMRCNKNKQRLQPASVNRNGPILLHDNAWLHITQLMLHKLIKLGY